MTAALVAAVTLLAVQQLRPGQRVITQDDIDAAVRESLEREPLPSAAAKAYEAILPSVVRVVGLMDEKDEGEDNAEQRAMERSLGTGVVIVDNGTILTNLHVVWGAKKVRVRFANGQESEATMIGAQPENDLAVLRAATLPDDLPAATLSESEALMVEFAGSHNSAELRRLTSHLLECVAPDIAEQKEACLLYTSPSPRDRTRSRMPSSA